MARLIGHGGPFSHLRIRWSVVDLGFKPDDVATTCT